VITIRIFRTREQAEFGKAVLASGGIVSEITEDMFHHVQIQQFSVPARFRLKVADEDFRKAAEFLAKKLKEQKVEG
jgi:hypothetical protein